jgi:hypothetical protein
MCITRKPYRRTQTKIQNKIQNKASTPKQNCANLPALSSFSSSFQVRCQVSEVSELLPYIRSMPRPFPRPFPCPFPSRVPATQRTPERASAPPPRRTAPAAPGSALPASGRWCPVCMYVCVCKCVWLEENCMKVNMHNVKEGTEDKTTTNIQWVLQVQMLAGISRAISEATAK